MERTGPLGELLALFDAVVESSTEGVRKPEPEIYRRALARLSEAVGRPIEAADCAYLDDLGINLKPARELGFRHDQGGRPGGRAGRALGAGRLPAGRRRVTPSEHGARGSSVL